MADIRHHGFVPFCGDWRPLRNVAEFAAVHPRRTGLGHVSGHSNAGGCGGGAIAIPRRKWVAVMSERLSFANRVIGVLQRRGCRQGCRFDRPPHRAARVLDPGTHPSCSAYVEVRPVAPLLTSLDRCLQARATNDVGVGHSNFLAWRPQGLPCLSGRP